jgi:predicted dehydrogenase
VTGEIREHHLGVVLNYEPGASDRVSTVAATTSTHRPRARVGFGVLGTGAFATGVLLPALSRIDRAEFVAATSARGLSARAAVDKFGGRRVAESLDELLAIPDVDAVMIATRHADHAAHAVRALRAGKDVFLEKPAALDAEQLDELEAAVIASPGRLLVGFNRRFAPLARQLKDHFAHRRTGLVINARINAGSIPDESWIQQTSEGGGRVIGEACHFIDLMSYWTDGEPTRVSCFGISQAAPHGGHDNLAILIEFSDGSVGTLTYAAMGDPSIGKERYEVFSEGAVAVLEDWKRLHLTRGGKTKTVSTWRVDKGHEGELRAFVDACVAGAPSPIAWRSIAATTRATFAAELARRTHAAVEF